MCCPSEGKGAGTTLDIEMYCRRKAPLPRLRPELKLKSEKEAAMQRLTGGTFQMKATVSAKFLLGQSTACSRSRVTGTERVKRPGAGEGPREEGCWDSQAMERHLAIKSYFPSCILQITLFILSFDIFIKHFLGARHSKM